MTEQIFTIRIVNGQVTMTFDDFAKLSGALVKFGVDVDVLDGSTLEQVSFKLKESRPNQ